MVGMDGSLFEAPFTVYPTHYARSSSDRRLIAYPNEDFHLFVLDANRLQVRQVTNSSNDDKPVGFSPDGQWLIFARFHDSNFISLYRIQPNGQQAAVLYDSLNVGRSLLRARWSPDGEWAAMCDSQDRMLIFNPARVIAHFMEDISCHSLSRGQAVWSSDNAWLIHLLEDASVGEHRLWQVSVMDGERQLLWDPPEAQLQLAGLSPDGEWLYLNAANGSLLYRLRQDGSDVQRLPQPNYRVVAGSWASAWSPDSNWMVLLVHDGGSTGFECYIASPDGSVLYPISDIAGPEQFIDWSPDSERVYFYAEHQQALYRTQVGGSQQQRLTSSRTNIYDLNWSPDQQWVAFNSHEDATTSVLNIMRPDGTDLSQFPCGETICFVQWSPDSQWVFVAAPDFGPFWVRPDGTDMLNIADRTDSQGASGLWLPPIEYPWNPLRLLGVAGVLLGAVVFWGWRRRT